jgi:hypothetical protein
MQKIVYLSNSRDYTEQKDVNENRYLTKINHLLEEGWSISTVLPNVSPVEQVVELVKMEAPFHKETLAAWIVLEKSDEER